MERRRELGLFSLQMTERRRISVAVYNYLTGGGEDGATLFSDMPHKRTRSNGHKS